MNGAYSYEVLETTDKQFICTFKSDGPKGIIKKRVSFSKLNDICYNLGFEDQKPDGSYSDVAESGNDDAEKIFFTIANAVMEFTDHNHLMRIYIEGVDEKRTRLYRICINKHRKIINQHFILYGLLQSFALQRFRRNGKYISFEAIRKYNSFTENKSI